MKPSEEQRKELTEFIGECWEYGYLMDCDKCGCPIIFNRTFAEWAEGRFKEEY